MSTGHEILSVEQTTSVEWRRSSDGRLVAASTLARGTSIDLRQPITDAYDVLTRPISSVGEWTEVAHVDPAKGSITRHYLWAE